jgi:cytochrome b561
MVGIVAALLVMKPQQKQTPKSTKNMHLALGLLVVALAVGVSVFWWRLSHKMPPMPQGSVYGTAYLPVPLQQGVVLASPTVIE